MTTTLLYFPGEGGVLTFSLIEKTRAPYREKKEKRESVLEEEKGEQKEKRKKKKKRRKKQEWEFSV